jgi:hypothetical protein
MNPVKGYYSIIQYCPDLGRVEAANVGVLLFCPESRFLKALTATRNSRIIRFFGSEGHDWKRINLFKRGLADRLENEAAGIRTLADLQQFIATRANVLQITAPNPVKVTDPEQTLLELFEEIIGEPVRKEHPKSLQRYLGEQLAAPLIAKKIVRDVTVTVKVLEKDVEVPFAFQNGRFNLIRPVPFLAQNPEQSIGTACKYAVEGQSLYEHEDPLRGEMQLFVVGQFRSNDLKTPDRVANLFHDYHVKLFRTDQLPQLIDEIRLTGKDSPGAL